jgi:inorganic pyrophosphatase
MNQKVHVYIEIEKHSNIKYEFNKTKSVLEIDRILPYPYFYPYCYGFIPKTKADDDDELDILIITDKALEKDKLYDTFIVGVLDMSDEKGKDEKVLCVLEEDYKIINDLDDLSEEIKQNIEWFFANYKSKTPNKWSKVHGFRNKTDAINLYEKYSTAYRKEQWVLLNANF